MHLNDLNVRKSNKLSLLRFLDFTIVPGITSIAKIQIPLQDFLCPYQAKIRTQNYILVQHKIMAYLPLYFHEKSVKREQLGYKFLKTLDQPESAQNSSFLTNMIYCNRGF